jgi:hypothetical protein
VPSGPPRHLTAAPYCHRPPRHSAGIISRAQVLDYYTGGGVVRLLLTMDAAAVVTSTELQLAGGQPAVVELSLACSWTGYRHAIGCGIEADGADRGRQHPTPRKPRYPLCTSAGPSSDPRLSSRLLPPLPPRT